MARPLLPERLVTRVQDALKAEVVDLCSVSGGDINRAYALRIRDSGSGAERRAFLKTHPSLPSEVFVREKEGLDFLRLTTALGIPAVLACSELSTTEPGFLVLAWIEPSTRSSAAVEEQPGRGIAELHRSQGSAFGLGCDNYLATLVQRNEFSSDWAGFYREARLRPLAMAARDKGVLGSALHRKLDRLFEKLPELVGPSEPPARLHGDLWGGNWMAATDGQAYLFDPAVYFGHREIDLAMMRLFGGFGARTFAAYEENYPPAPGAAERVRLYQLYPLLAHLVMFGASYASQVDDAVSAYL